MEITSTISECCLSPLGRFTDHYVVWNRYYFLHLINIIFCYFVDTNSHRTEPWSGLELEPRPADIWCIQPLYQLRNHGRWIYLETLFIVTYGMYLTMLVNPRMHSTGHPPFWQPMNNGGTTWDGPTPSHDGLEYWAYHIGADGPWEVTIVHDEGQCWCVIVSGKVQCHHQHVYWMMRRWNPHTLSFNDNVWYWRCCDYVGEGA